jgi:hypothetical protein
LKMSPSLRQSLLVFLLVLGGTLQVGEALQPRESMARSVSTKAAAGEMKQPLSRRSAAVPAGNASSVETLGNRVLNRFEDYPGSPLARGEPNRYLEEMPVGAALLLYATTCCVVLVASVLMLCCLYDAAAHWHHRAHYYSCQQKVRRVHETFAKKKGDQLLCPYCIEYICPTARGSGPVVFLCGHRFHTDCANKWFLKHPDKAGRCPLCEGSSDCPAPAKSNCESLSFILGSLHRKYPEIVTEANVNRWASCHTEIWLSEMRCPRYNSILHNKK